MHFSVIVAVGPDETLEQVLAPFDEELKVPEYVRDIVSRTDKKAFMDYYHEKYPTTADCKDFEKMYEDLVRVGTVVFGRRTRPMVNGRNSLPGTRTLSGIGIKLVDDGMESSAVRMR